MKSPQEILKRFRRGPADLLALDFRNEGVFAVRMRKAAGEVSLVAADLLDPIDLSGAEADGPMPSLSLPAALRARHASLVCSSDEAVIKVISLPGPFTDGAEEKLIRSLGLAKPEEYRIAYKVLVHGHGRNESRAVAVAVPEPAAAALAQVLATGLPVPFSLEAADTAALNAFLAGPGSRHAEECAGVIIFGDRRSCFAVFYRGIPSLIRHLPVGEDSFLEQIENTLGIDRATAAGILSDGSFDVSQSLAQIVEPLVKQLQLSRDFVERREHCHMNALYATGHLLNSNDVLAGIRTGIGMDVHEWNPFEAVSVPDGAIPDRLNGHERGFLSAVGACLGTFEET